MPHNQDISSGSTLFLKVKKDNQTKNTKSSFNYYLSPLDMYNELSQLIVSNQKEESISGFITLCWLLRECMLAAAFANSLDPDEDWHNVGPDLNPNSWHSDCIPERLYF